MTSAGTTRKPKPRPLKNPSGGLTAAGRKYFAETEGSHLRPGVTGKADTPEKMRRKGSFLRRHFANPRGPMRDENGKPTRLALSAHAWGEPVPKTLAAAKKLALKGTALLEKYKKAKAEEDKKMPAKKASSQKNSLVKNINKRKAAGTSRSKKKTTVSKKAYKEMTEGWEGKKRRVKK